MGKSVEEWVGMLELNSAGFQDYEPEVEGEGNRLTHAGNLLTHGSQA